MRHVWWLYILFLIGEWVRDMTVKSSCVVISSLSSLPMFAEVRSLWAVCDFL